MDRGAWRGLLSHGDELLERGNLRSMPPFGRGRVPEGKLEGPTDSVRNEMDLQLSMGCAAEMWNPFKEFPWPTRAKRMNGSDAPMHGMPLHHEDRKQAGHPLIGKVRLVARQASLLLGLHDVYARDSPLVRTTRIVRQAERSDHSVGCKQIPDHKHYAWVT